MPTLFILIALCGCQLEALPGPAGDEEIASLVEQLSDRKFSVRQAATSQLKAMGKAAVPALREAQANGGPEVRSRAAGILSHVLGSATRLAFLKDPTVATAQEIAGWQRLRLLAGSDDAAVSQLTRWLQEEPRLFEARVVGGRELAEELQQRSSALTDYRHARVPLKAVGDVENPALDTAQAVLAKGQFAKAIQILDALPAAQQNNTTKLALNKAREAQRTIDCVTAILFVSADPSIDLTRDAQAAIESVFEIGLTRLCLSPTIGNNKLVRQLTGAWIGRNGRQSQYQKLILSLKYSVPEGLPLAESIIRSKARGPRMEYALHIVGKLGDEKQIPLLESQLTNTVRLSAPYSAAVRNSDGRRRQGSYEYQVRDIALAMLWHLHGENPATRGFDKNRLAADRWYVFTLGSMGFSSDQQRDAAFATWQSFEDAGKAKPRK